MEDPLYLDPKTGRYYKLGKDEHGFDVPLYVEYQPEEHPRETPRHAAAPSDNNRDQDERYRRGSVYGSGSRPPTSSSSRGQTRRDSIHERSQKEYYVEGDRYPTTESQKIQQRSSSSKYHDRGGYSSPRPTAYEAPSGHDAAGEPIAVTTTYQGSRSHDSSGHPEYTSTPQAAVGPNGPDSLGGRMRAMSIHNDSTYATGSGQPYLAPYTEQIGNYAQTNFSYEETGHGATTSPRSSQAIPEKDRPAVPTRGSSQKLDKSYKVRKRDYRQFFQRGRVFQMLWTENYNGDTDKNPNNASVSSIIYDEKVYSKVRRFVVVRYKEGDRSCICLPITSYDGRGLDKQGINLSDHGFIYSHREPKGHKSISKKPLKVKLSQGAERLKETSLVNYASPQTIQTNSKVKDIGDLDDDGKKRVRRYYEETMAESDTDMRAVKSRTPRTQAADLVGMGGSLAPNVPAGSYDYQSQPPASSTYSTPLHSGYSRSGHTYSGGAQSSASYADQGHYSSTAGYDARHASNINPRGGYDTTPHYPAASSSAAYPAATTPSPYYPASGSSVNYTTYGPAAISTYSNPGSTSTMTGGQAPDTSYHSGQSYSSDTYSLQTSYSPYTSNPPAGTSQNYYTSQQIPRTYYPPPSHESGYPQHNHAAGEEDVTLPGSLNEARDYRDSRRYRKD